MSSIAHRTSSLKLNPVWRIISAPRRRGRASLEIEFGENRREQLHPFGVTGVREVEFVGGEVLEVRGAVLVGGGGEQVAEVGVLALRRQLANAVVHGLAVCRFDRRLGVGA